MELHRIMICFAVFLSVCFFAIGADADVKQSLKTPLAQSVKGASQQKPITNRLKRSWHPTVYSYNRFHLYPYAYAVVPYYRTITLKVTHPLDVLRRGVERLLFGREIVMKEGEK